MADESLQTSDSTASDLAERRNRRMNNLLTAMVAIYGILTASAAYMAAITGGYSDDNNIQGLKHLTDANFFYTEGSRQISYDVWLIDQSYINSQFGADESLFEYFYESLSAEGQAALERDGLINDDEYQEAVYVLGNDYQTLADESFELAEKWGARSDLYQLYTTMLAVGLSFAAWASLMDQPTTGKRMFTFMAALILAASLIAVIGTGALSEPLPVLASEQILEE